MSIEAFDIREADTPYGAGRERCSRCEGFRILVADGLCFGCLNYKAVPARSHVPKPRYRVHVYGPGGVLVGGPWDFVTEMAVDHCREMWACEGHSFCVDYINSKAGVLR
jgi:hypothetical protein